MTVRADGRLTNTVGIPGTGVRHQMTMGAGAPIDHMANVTTPAKGCLGCFGFLMAVGVACAMIGGAADGGGTAGGLTMAAILGGTWGGVTLLVRRGKARRRREAAERAGHELKRLETERDERQQKLWTLYCEAFGVDAARMMWIGKPWQGATAEMIETMLGKPVAVSTKVMKTKTSETWKYDPLDARRFAMKITFEDGVCVGWETS